MRLINAGIAQLVERNLAKVEVESSRLFSRSSFEKRKSIGFLFFRLHVQSLPDSDGFFAAAAPNSHPPSARHRAGSTVAPILTDVAMSAMREAGDGRTYMVTSVIDTAIGFFKGIGDKIDHTVNSSEHNFKKKLIEQLKAAGVDQATLDAIKDVGNNPPDQKLTERLQALIATGAIPSAAIPMMQQLAAQEGVPTTSIDPARLDEPMSLEDAAKYIKPEQMQKLGRQDVLDALAEEQKQEDAARQQVAANPQTFTQRN